uniref:Predicted protein n=1 Tax=Hordeum vulgare subsp. vulgare TaxID=112509 RepID=F2E329_HORVV|nr:predicted protein [Hordeum vulgare subsp. vulgare]
MDDQFQDQLLSTWITNDYPPRTSQDAVDPSKDVKLTVYHKPRGSKGAWCAIVQNESVRIAKKSGKRMLISIQTFERTWPNISLHQIRESLFLMTKEGPIQGLSKSHLTAENNGSFTGFIFQSIQKVNPYCLEVIITLFSKSEIYFGFNFTVEQKATFVGQSVSFKTHNSGSLGSRLVKAPDSKSPPSSPENSSDIESSGPQPQQRPKDDVLELPRFVPPPLVLPNPQYTVQQLGNVTVVPGNLDVSNGFVVSQQFVQLSDRKLKENIVDLSNALDIVSKLKGKTFTWKNNQQHCLGFIANEVEEVLPSIVVSDPSSGCKAISYVELFPVLVNSINEVNHKHNAEVTKLQRQLRMQFYLSLMIFALLVFFVIRLL